MFLIMAYLKKILEVDFEASIIDADFRKDIRRVPTSEENVAAKKFGDKPFSEGFKKAVEVHFHDATCCLSSSFPRAR